MHLDLGDPWCRLPGVECHSAVPRLLYCRHHGAATFLCCSSQPFHLFTALPRCGLQTGPTPYIALANECTWAQALSAPKGLPAPCVSSAPVHRCNVHASHWPAVHLYLLEKCRWSPPAVAAPFHHVSSYLLAVWATLWHSMARGGQLYAAVEWSPGIAISPIATRHAADPPASS